MISDGHGGSTERDCPPRAGVARYLIFHDGGYIWQAPHHFGAIWKGKEKIPVTNDFLPAASQNQVPQSWGLLLSHVFSSPFSSFWVEFFNFASHVSLPSQKEDGGHTELLLLT